MAPHPAAPALRRRPNRTFIEKTGKQAAGHAAHQRTQQHPHQHIRQRLAVKARKIRVVALHRHLDKARSQHADKNLPLPAQHHPAPQLFNRKHHPCQRRIKRRRQAARRTGGEQIVFLQALKSQIVFFAPRAPSQHHRRAHLHRRPFAPDRRPREHAQKRERDFQHRLPQLHQPRFLRPVRQRERSEHLRNAAARRVGRKTAREPHNQRQPQRQREPGIPRILLHPVCILLQRPIGHFGKHQRSERHQRRTGQQKSKCRRFARQTLRLHQFVRQLSAEAPARV